MKRLMVLSLAGLLAAPLIASAQEVTYSCEFNKHERKGGREKCYVSGERPVSGDLSMKVRCTTEFELDDAAVEVFIGAPINSGKNILHATDGDKEAYLHIKGEEKVGDAFRSRLITIDGSEAETFTGLCTVVSSVASI